MVAPTTGQLRSAARRAFSAPAASASISQRMRAASPGEDASCGAWHTGIDMVLMIGNDDCIDMVLRMTLTVRLLRHAASASSSHRMRAAPLASLGEL